MSVKLHHVWKALISGYTYFEYSLIAALESKALRVLQIGKTTLVQV